MRGMKDGTHLYAVERRERYGERPGFKITELQLSPGQRVPWHLHTVVRDTFYVISGRIVVHLDDPKESVVLDPTMTCAARPGRPHLVVNPGPSTATFLVIGDAQAAGEYDFVPLPSLEERGVNRPGPG
jgi:mannose-6-phosphate isomerase-like protein (cupin superfamily)